MPLEVQECECLSTNIAVFLAIASALSVLLLANYLYFGLTCRGARGNQQNNINSTQIFTEKIHWDGAVRLTIDEKNITLLRTMAKHRCYILPKTSAVMRKLQLVREIIDNNDKLNVLGKDGLRFCSDDKIYLLETLSDNPRQKREAAIEAAVDPLQVSYEDRSPRCVDLILDCAEGQIGEVRSCYTWINGAMTMKQTCLSPKEFKVTLTKPTGRIMKVQREQAAICFERRQNGLRC
uniref:Uncharacterized protein n=1 Tax=Panagrolaimus sp. ES5 TaxID=591445 RepID=A0AC34F1Y5_9BILA